MRLNSRCATSLSFGANTSTSESSGHLVEGASGSTTGGSGRSLDSCDEINGVAVRCSVLQCGVSHIWLHDNSCVEINGIAVCCSALQCRVITGSSGPRFLWQNKWSCSAWQCAAVCSSVRQCVAVCGSVWRCVAVCCSVWRCVAVCCSVWRCVAVCCSVLQCVAVSGSELQCVAVRCIAVRSQSTLAAAGAASIPVTKQTYSVYLDKTNLISYFC